MALLLTASATALAASFECGKARSKTEKLICSDAEVSALDETLNVAYKRAIDRVADKPGLRQSQRDWLASYSLTECSTPACLREAFAERIAVLDDVAEPDVAASKWSGKFVRYWKGKEDRHTASIALLGLRSGRLYVSGAALWLGPNASEGQVNTGDITGYSKLVSPDGTALVDVDGCTAQLKLSGDTVEVTNESGCGGHNVTFDGQYRRTAKRR